MRFSEFLCESKQNKPEKKGFLIAIEAQDGAGKSTLAKALHKWLTKEGYDIVETKWNSSPSIKPAIDRSKKEKILTPQLFCLLHACDMVARYEATIKPSLEQNKIVISDRYIYTSYARDIARGINPTLLDLIYKEFRKPDVLLHLAIPTEKAVIRLIKDKGKIGYYSGGMDLNLSNNKEDSCIKYQKMAESTYAKILPKVESYHKINADQDKENVFKEAKTIIEESLRKQHYKNK